MMRKPKRLFFLLLLPFLFHCGGSGSSPSQNKSETQPLHVSKIVPLTFDENNSLQMNLGNYGFHNKYHLGHQLSEQGGIPAPIGDHQFQELVILSEIVHQTVEIAITGNDEGLVVVWIFNHGVKDEFRIHVPFDLSVGQRKRRFENEDIARLLERGVEVLEKLS